MSEPMWNKGKDTVKGKDDSVKESTDTSFQLDTLNEILIELKLLNQYNAMSHNETLTEEDL